MKIAKLLAKNRTPDSHLAGGAALHFQPNSIRFSNDLDYFHDSLERVASAFQQDEKLLRESGYVLTPQIQQLGYVRVQVQEAENTTKAKNTTKIEWSYDSAWRFMPVIQNNDYGFQLHPIDLAINKVLALVGRNEPRDFLDILFCHNTILPLGPLCWAACGKDPGFSPLSLLELLKRRGKFQPQDFDRLLLTEPIDLVLLKTQWRSALDSAEVFIQGRPPSEVGCLYYSLQTQTFFAPQPISSVEASTQYVVHYGTLGGVLPTFIT